MNDVKVLKSNAIQEILTELRDEKTETLVFRKDINKISRYIAYEILNDFETKTVKVKTQLGVEADGIDIPGKEHIVLINVLRASTPMIEGFFKVFPKAKVGFVSAIRKKDEKGVSKTDTGSEITYKRLPKMTEEDTIIFPDPMLARGETLIDVMNVVLQNVKPKKIIVVGLMATQYAIDKILKEFPESNIYVCAIDSHSGDDFIAPGLDKKAYIVPGLGDAGDRIFGEPI